MSARETTDLRSLTDAQLTTQLQETYQALFNLRFQAATRQLADVAEVGKAKRRIAKIKTLIRERELLAEIDAVAASQNGN
jgi:large subunit ribosomal protein L29